jgi:hypothetical protein
MASRMTITIDRPRKFVLLAIVAAGMLPAAAAHAHWDRWSHAEPAPLYPYAVPEEGPFAVELAPNIYAIPYPLAAFPYVHCLDGCGRRAPIAQWRRHHVKRNASNSTIIVHDEPVVIETERVVDDPPRVIERRHMVEDAASDSSRPPAVTGHRSAGKRAGRDAGKRRVLQADAEVTIIEPDRMIIRLRRKPHDPRGNVPVDE